jgi:hypothetical protein
MGTGQVTNFHCVLPPTGEEQRPVRMPLLLRPAVILPQQFRDSAVGRAGDSTPVIVAIRSQRRVCRVDLPPSSTAMPSTEGALALCGSKFWDLPNTPLSSPTCSLAVSPFGQALVAGCDDGSVHVWALASPAEGGFAVYAASAMPRDRGRLTRSVGEASGGGGAATCTVAVSEWCSGSDSHVAPLVVACFREDSTGEIVVFPRWSGASLKHMEDRKLSVPIAVPSSVVCASIVPLCNDRLQCLLVAGTARGQVLVWLVSGEEHGTDGLDASAYLLAEYMVLEGAALSRPVPVQSIDVCFAPTQRTRDALRSRESTGSLDDTVAIVAVGGLDGRVRSLALMVRGWGRHFPSLLDTATHLQASDAASLLQAAAVASHGCGVHFVSAESILLESAVDSRHQGVSTVAFHPFLRQGGHLAPRTSNPSTQPQMLTALLASSDAGDVVLWAECDWPSLTMSGDEPPAKPRPEATDDVDRFEQFLLKVGTETASSILGSELMDRSVRPDSVHGKKRAEEPRAELPRPVTHVDDEGEHMPPVARAAHSWPQHDGEDEQDEEPRAELPRPVTHVDDEGEHMPLVARAAHSWPQHDGEDEQDEEPMPVAGLPCPVSKAVIPPRDNDLASSDAQERLLRLPDRMQARSEEAARRRRERELETQRHSRRLRMWAGASRSAQRLIESGKGRGPSRRRIPREFWNPARAQALAASLEEMEARDIANVEDPEDAPWLSPTAHPMASPQQFSSLRMLREAQALREEDPYSAAGECLTEAELAISRLAADRIRRRQAWK